MSGWEPWLSQFPEPAHFAAIFDFNGACCCQKSLPGVDPKVVSALAKDLMSKDFSNVQSQGLTLGCTKFTFVRDIVDDNSVVLVFKGKGDCKGTLAVKLSNTLVIIAGGQGAGQEEGNVIIKYVENAVEQLKNSNL